MNKRTREQLDKRNTRRRERRASDLEFRDRERAYKRKHIAANPHYRARECANQLKRNRHPLKVTRAGITNLEREIAFAAQGGTCAICGTSGPMRPGWCADHCHTTGVFRGVLCSKCNTGLGMFKDDPVLLASAIDYLTMKGKSQ